MFNPLMQQQNQQFGAARTGFQAFQNPMMSAFSFQPQQQMQPYQGYGQQQQMWNQPMISEQEQSSILNYFYQAAGIDRHLDINEFAMVLAQLQPQLSQSPQYSMIVQRYFMDVDTNRNGLIDANEFLNAYMKLISTNSF